MRAADNHVVARRTDDGVVAVTALDFRDVGQRRRREVQAVVRRRATDHIETGAAVDLFDGAAGVEGHVDADDIVARRTDHPVRALVAKETVEAVGLAAHLERVVA